PRARSQGYGRCEASPRASPGPMECQMDRNLYGHGAMPRKPVGIRNLDDSPGPDATGSHAVQSRLCKSDSSSPGSRYRPKMGIWIGLRMLSGSEAWLCPAYSNKVKVTRYTESVGQPLQALAGMTRAEIQEALGERKDAKMRAA